MTEQKHMADRESAGHTLHSIASHRNAIFYNYPIKLTMKEFCIILFVVVAGASTYPYLTPPRPPPPTSNNANNVRLYQNAKRICKMCKATVHDLTSVLFVQVFFHWNCI